MHVASDLLDSLLDLFTKIVHLFEKCLLYKLDSWKSYPTSQNT